MKILVTGGSGFIGANLVADLIDRGHVVSIYDKTVSDPFAHMTIKGDVRDRDALVKASRGMDAIYHLAAEHRDDVRPVSLYYDVNVGGAENVVHAARKNDIQRVVFTSSVAIYGLNNGVPNEKSTPDPFNDYSASKLKSEEVFNNWADDHSSRSLVIVRPVVVFGEKNRGNVFELLNQIAGGRFVMVGHGKNKKSMAYVRNISSFMCELLNLGPGRHVYNYADKPDLTVHELVRLAYTALGKQSEPHLRIPYSIGMLGGYFFDLLARATGGTFPISSIRIKKFVADTTVSAEKLKEIGFVAPYSLADGLERMMSSEFPARATRAD